MNAKQATLFRYIKAASLLALSLSLASCSEMFEDRVEMQNTGSNGTLSTLVVSKTALEKLPPPSQIFVSAPQKDRIEISWSPVAGAASYRVERAQATSKNGKWVVPTGEEFEVLEHSKSVYSTYFTDLIIDDSKANPLNMENEAYGRAYFYRVAAENIIDGLTAEEDADYIMTDSATLLAPPPTVYASQGESQTEVVVSWQKPNIDGVKNYEIWRSLSEDNAGAIKMAKVTAGSEQWVDTSIQKGVDYYYTVYSQSAGGTSVQSAIAYGYALQDGAPGRPSNVRVTSGRGNTNNTITIEWEAAANATGYYVYRSSSKDSTSVKLARKDGSSTLTHTDDKSLKPNVYYYYEIKPFKTVDQDGTTVEIAGPMSQS